MSVTHQSDLAIIGSGSGNTLITPFWDDKSVVLADGGIFGGTCLNVGCIPTKMFVRPAQLARTPAEAARLGVTMHTEGSDWASIRDRIFSRIDPISKAGRNYRAELPHVQLVEQQVTLDGTHAFVAPDGTRVETKQLVIAAGSRAVLPEVPGIDLDGVHTSDTIMRIDELPQRIVIIGGGYIACEFAAIFSGLGSHVTQLVRGDVLMRDLDEEIRDAFNAEATSHWDVRFNHPIKRIVAGPTGGLTVGTDTEAFDADVVLVATGRTPNTDLIGAAEAGLDLHDDGRLVVDAYQRVLRDGQPVEGVYALGDISSPHQLKHVANYEARVVAHNLEHPDVLRPNEQPPVPAAVFTHPELATVGLTETQAREEFGADHVKAHTQRYGDTAYGWAMEDGAALFKVVSDARTGKILGAHVMGYQASNLIQPVITAMSFDITAHDFARGQYWIHPALMEVTENAILGVTNE